VSSNYGRFLRVTVGSTVINAVEGVGPPIGLRVRFQMKLFGAGIDTNKLTMKITNPLPTMAQSIVGAPSGMGIVVDAGYEDNHAIIFTGRIVDAIYGRDSPTDTLLTIIAADNDVAHNWAVVNTSLAAGSTPMDQINVAVKAMQEQDAGFGIGYLDPALKLSTPVYPRGVPLYGMAWRVFENIARSKRADVSYQQGQLQIIGHKNTIPGDAFVLNTNTGLIGMPTQDINGIMARSLINPSIKINTLVQIAQALVQGTQFPIKNNSGGVLDPVTVSQTPNIAADGFYKVLGIDFNGDTRGNPWYMDLNCVSPSDLASGSVPLTPILQFAAGGPPAAPGQGGIGHQ
jgi:hypothetical protein